MRILGGGAGKQGFLIKKYIDICDKILLFKSINRWQLDPLRMVTTLK